jgi:hypothetical protein
LLSYGLGPLQYGLLPFCCELFDSFKVQGCQVFGGCAYGYCSDAVCCTGKCTHFTIYLNLMDVETSCLQSTSHCVP